MLPSGKRMTSQGAVTFCNLPAFVAESFKKVDGVKTKSAGVYSR
jgi:hypothetical protein